MSLYDYQLDGHCLVSDGEGGLNVACPVVGVGHLADPCRKPFAFGGPARWPYISCGLDAWWPDFLGDYLDPDILVGVGLADGEICWRVAWDGVGLIWAPRWWVEARAQVTA